MSYLFTSLFSFIQYMYAYSMASIGVHTNASQFYLTLGEAKHLNGRCVTFGRVIEGDSVLKTIEEVCLFVNVLPFPVLETYLLS